MAAGQYNGVDLSCGKLFLQHLFLFCCSCPTFVRRPPKRQSLRMDQALPSEARALLFPVGLPPLRLALRFWNKAETPPMQVPRLSWPFP